MPNRIAYMALLDSVKLLSQNTAIMVMVWCMLLSALKIQYFRSPIHIFEKKSTLGLHILKIYYNKGHEG